MKNSIIEKITQLKEKCMLHEDQLRETTDLSPSEYTAILNIGMDDTIKSNEFADKMDLSPSRGSRVVDKLIKRGFIKSKKLKTDKRSINLSLTDEGKVLKKDLENLRCNCNKKIEENFSDEEIKKIEISIDKLIKVL